MKIVTLHALSFGLAALLGGPAFSAELGPGDARTPATAVPVLSAESEADLNESVDAWILRASPNAKFVRRGFQYLADDRALMVIWTLDETGRRKAFYFETPGLPFQFVGKRK
jgi:hypothetical protein